MGSWVGWKGNGNVRACALSALGLLATSACVGDAPADPAARLPALAGLTATARSTSEVMLAWSPATSPEVREATIERASEYGSFGPVATIPAEVVSYGDSGLTPATTYRYRLRVCGEAGCSAYTGASVRTLGTLLVTTENLPEAIIGTSYAAHLGAAGGAPQYAWSVAGGALPAGVTLSELGALSGTAERAQSASFVAQVRSDDGQTATRQLTLRVVESVSGPPVTISTVSLPPVLVGAPFDVWLRALGGVPGGLAWDVVSGSLPPGVTLSAAGQLAGTPSRAGTFPFTVSASSGGRTAEKAIALEVIPDDGERFDITAYEVAAVSAEVRPHLEAAIERWEQIITGDLPSARIPTTFFGTTHCGGFGPLVNGTAVEDLIVIVDISPIDGAGNILGQAGPCGLRPNRLPFVGVLILDSSDLAAIVGRQTLTDIFFHEIGHILGFGAIWGASGLLTGIGGWDPRFMGPFAMDQLRELGEEGGVPVENTGPVGTAWVHWRESFFTTEIMTGYAERVGTRMPVSRVTIASMADLGYSVDLSAADEYELPLIAAPPAAPLEPLGFDVLLPGPVKVLPGSDDAAAPPRASPPR